MTTIAIVGAGPGLGAAVARRFGAEGFAVGLISRSQERADGLAAQLVADGVQAKGFAARRPRPGIAGQGAGSGDRDPGADRGPPVQPAAAEGLHAPGDGDDAGRPRRTGRVLDLRAGRRRPSGRARHALPRREPRHDPVRQRRHRARARAPISPGRASRSPARPPTPSCSTRPSPRRASTSPSSSSAAPSSPATPRRTPRSSPGSCGTCTPSATGSGSRSPPADPRSAPVDRAHGRLTAQAGHDGRAAGYRLRPP